MRKRANMPWHSFVERQILQAQEEGKFDKLPGAGKPLADLDEPFDADWWVKKLAKREGLPLADGSLATRLMVDKALQRIWRLPAESAVRRHVTLLNTKIREANRSPLSGPASTCAPLDLDTVLKTWRQRRCRTGSGT